MEGVSTRPDGMGNRVVFLVSCPDQRNGSRAFVPSAFRLFHPPALKELNPVENIWQFMRDNWLSNHIFETYDDIVDHCCDAWNKLIGQPERIMSIGCRQWALEF